MRPKLGTNCTLFLSFRAFPWICAAARGCKPTLGANRHSEYHPHYHEHNYEDIQCWISWLVPLSKWLISFSFNIYYWILTIGNATDFIFEKLSDEDASYWNACCKPAQNVKCPNISIIEPRGNVQNVQTFSNSQIYQNSDLFNNWTRINCCTLWSWLSVATNNQHILDRTKMRAN